MAFTITTPVNIDSLTKVGAATGLAWTRVTTTITVTHNSHGLVTGDLVYVNTSSDTGAIPLGSKSVTVLTANTYTFTGVNTGAASGTISITVRDVYNINGGYLTVDQDSRYGTNANTSTILGAINLSATLGGTIEFNAENVRIIPYDGGSGTVPAANTTISGTTGNGKLIGVYADLVSAPTAVGAATPATGFIKIKQWNGNTFSDNESLTGITATVNGTDQVGWIEIVGMDANICTVNRLNTFKTRGAWYNFLGVTTDGNRATTYQIPTNGSAVVYLPGVWVETDVADVYEFYPCAGTRTALLANIATDAVRGKYCWISAGGVLRFGHDGTNSTGGYIPPSGRKIRIPNIFFYCATQAAPTVNVFPNATLTTRYTFSTGGGGVIDIDKGCFAWYCNFAQPFSVSLTNTAILNTLVCSEIASPITWSHIGIGQITTTENIQTGLTISLCFAGGTISNCTWTSISQAASGRYIVSITDCAGFTFNNNKALTLLKAANATAGSYTITRLVNSTFNDTILGAGRMFFTTCTNIIVNDTIYFDHPATTTSATIPMYAFTVGTNCLNIKFDGLTFGGLVLVQPYSGILNVAAAGCTNITLRNLGTYDSRLDCGHTQRNNVSWSRVTTTATVTQVSHGLKVGDIIYCPISSDIAAITAGTTKTVATTPTADTFTFTALNAGATSGTLTYYPIMAGSLVVLDTGAAANTVRLERCYLNRLRTVLFSADNSSKNIIFKNCYGDAYNSAGLTPFLNATLEGLIFTPALTSQSSCYGTHWLDYFITNNTANRTSVSWSRTTTTATITSNDHNLITGQLINVTVSSDTGAIVLGQKTITATTSNTFTFTCLNAGGTSGTITFEPLTSRIALLMNESTAETANQYTIDNGTPSFTSAGTLYMPTIDQQITFTSPDYILGHTGFPIAEAVMGGGTIANYDITYAIDKNDGNGFSSFKNLYYNRITGGGSNGSTNVTMADTTGVAVGDYVWGTNIGPNAKVSSITNGTTIVVDNPNIGTVSGTLRFNQLPSETGIDASKGFKLKIRIKTRSTNATAITFFYIVTSNNATSRQYQYPIDLVTITLTGLKNPTEVRVFDAGTTTEISSTGNESVTTGSHSFQVTAGTPVDISILSLGYQNLRLLNYSTTESASIPISQVIDRQYAN